MKKIILLIAIVFQVSNCSCQLVLTDSVKRIKGIDYKVSYAVNTSKTEVYKFVYYDDAKKLITETIIEVPPNSCAITGFTNLKIVNKIQSTTDKGITDELDKQKIPYDKDKIIPGNISVTEKTK